MRVQIPVRRLLGGAAAVGAVALAGDARAATVEPLLDTSVVDRVHQLVPLGPAGATIALNAESSERGERVGTNSYLTTPGIYFAAADGTGLRSVYAAPHGTGMRALTASGDGSHVAWVLDDVGRDRPYLMDAATETTRPLRGAGDAGFDFRFVPAADRLYAVMRDQRVLRRVDAERRRLVAVPKSGASGRVAGESFAVSGSGEQVGSCALLRRGRRSAGVRLGLLDKAAGVRRVTGIQSRGRRLDGDGPTCAVADGGTTVVAVDGNTLFAVRDGRPVKLRLPRNLTQVGAVSPSGRFAVVGGGRHVIRGFLHLDRAVAVVDLDSGRVAAVSRLSSYAKRRRGVGGVQGAAVWSPDESRVALSPSSGGVMLISTGSAAVRFVRTPSPPPGFLFSSRGALARLVGFSPDGLQLIVTYGDRAGDITTDHPYAIPVASGGPRYLLTGSMRSFQGVVRSADGATTWLLPSSTCSSVYPQPLLRLVGGELWDGPFQATASPFG